MLFACGVQFTSETDAGPSAGGGFGGSGGDVPTGGAGASGTEPRCGNGIIDVGLNEACDDGDDSDDQDGCHQCEMQCRLASDDTTWGVLNPANGHCYMVREQGGSWDDAKQRCDAWRQGATPVALSTVGEAEFFEAAMVSNDTPYTWVFLNGTDVDDDGNWAWGNGEPWEYQNWDSAEGQPVTEDGGFPAHCSVRTEDGLWHARPCNFHNNLACAQLISSPRQCVQRGSATFSLAMSAATVSSPR